MAEQITNEASSSKHIVSGESSDSNIELNVKTLNSRIYRFVVDRNMPVLAFKEKIANEVGLSASQQKLLFRGMVLKDEHRLFEYHVECGHTLYLVERQQTQSQQPSDSGSGEPNSSGASRVLWTDNVGYQGERGELDISRLNVTVQGPAGNEPEHGRSNVGDQNQSGSQPSTGPSSPMHEVMQIPLEGASIPSLLLPIPDSLFTIMDFMNRMEMTAHMGYRPNTSRIWSAQVPANTGGLASIVALGIVLRQADQLLRGQTVAALSHFAGRWEQDSASPDMLVRTQIQEEAALLGIILQHLGALMLELSRTMLTLQMRQPPGQSIVRSGPAMFISPSGPNPIMAQPFPLQTTSLWGSSVPPANSMLFDPTGAGNPPRNINIQMHAALGDIGQVNGGDGLHGEPGNASSDSTEARNLGNVFCGTMPPHSSGISGSGFPQPSTVPGSQSNPHSSLLGQISSQFSSLAGEGPEETQTPGQTAASVGSSSVGSTASTSELAGEIEEPSLFLTESRAFRHQSEHKAESESIKAPKVEDSKGSAASTDTLTGLPGRSSSSSEDVLKAEAGSITVESRDDPICLGRGGLDPKKRGKQPKTQAKGEEAGPATTLPDKTDASTSSGQILQARLSRGSNVQPTGTGPSPSSGQATDFPLSRGQVPDVGDIISQVLQSSMLNGLLSGVSEQTGAGSLDFLTNMLQRVTQHPAMMNVVGQIGQQINPQDLGGMGDQGGDGHGGGIDLSSMMQPMVPIVSQALGDCGSGHAQPFADLVRDFQTRTSEGFTRRDERGNSHVDQVGLQDVVRHIENLDSSQDVFRSMAETVAQLHDDETASCDILSALSNEEDLANQYAEILRRDLSKRHEHVE